MSAESLFISDLHLREDRPDNTDRFLEFLENRASGIEALYILGDLFDIWIGDDDPTPPNREVIKYLKRVTDSGTQVFFQRGNRDFLLGERFSYETGIQFLDDYCVIDLYGTQTLVTHGDLLCTDDLPYQAFRKKTRDPEWQNKMLSKPLFIRVLIARWYQFRTRRDKRKKSMAIMDVNSQFVIETLKLYKVNRLIHGHTHRPNIHELKVDNNLAYRFVLAEWDNSSSVLCWNAEGFRIEAGP